MDFFLQGGGAVRAIARAHQRFSLKGGAAPSRPTPCQSRAPLLISRYYCGSSHQAHNAAARLALSFFIASSLRFHSVHENRNPEKKHVPCAPRALKRASAWVLNLPRGCTMVRDFDMRMFFFCAFGHFVTHTNTNISLSSSSPLLHPQKTGDVRAREAPEAHGLPAGGAQRHARAAQGPARQAR